VEIAGQTFIAKIPQTGDWDKSQGCFGGKIEIKQAGVQTLKVRPADAKKWKAVNLRAVRLSPVE